MSQNKNKSKRREFVLTGITAPLKDGETRSITLVAVVTAQEVTETKRSACYREEGRKRTQIVTAEDVDITRTTMAIGLSVVSPADVAVADANLGKQIAIGKALKPKTAIATMVSDDKIFSKSIVEAILNEKMKHICSDPDRYIVVSENKIGVSQIPSTAAEAGRDRVSAPSQVENIGV